METLLKTHLLRILFAGLVLTHTFAARAEPQPIDFNRDIRPILSNACFHCHGPDEANRAGDLRLDDEEAAKAFAIIPGDAESELILRITSEDSFDRMPPRKQTQQLTAEQIELLKRWVAEGAPWAKHWAYEPPVKAPEPEVGTGAWPRNPIDGFALSRLEAERLGPSPEAAPEALIRRVTLDLTGLPPTPEQIDVFLADDQPGAYERVVDRLLQSPRYGEHMALPWLAAARYADTNGYQQDRTRTMWPWRDWVVQAMNDNMPFDQFTIQQLAGDLLDDPTPQQLVATGFHRNHALNGEGGRNPEESRVEYVIDRASTTSTVWMGMTAGCARCHDHKYDAISQQEFYELYAYFNSIDEVGGVDAAGNAKPVMALPTEAQQAEVERLDQKIGALEEKIASLQLPLEAEQTAWEDDARRWLKLADIGRLWEACRPATLVCKGGVEWDQLEDGSVLIRDMPNHRDDYVVKIDQVPAGVYRSLRLEAIKDATMVNGWFSRGIDGGFSVTDMQVEIDGKPVKLHNPRTNLGGQKVAQALIDGQKSTEWVVRKPESAPDVPVWIGDFQAPLEIKDGTVLTVRMKHQARTGDAPIGRFRLSVTKHPQVTLDANLGFSSQLVGLLRKPVDQLTEADRDALVMRHHQIQQERLRDEVRGVQSVRSKAQNRQLHTMVMRDRKTPRSTYLLKSGLWNQPDKSKNLEPGVPACLPALPEAAPKNRLALARWLMRPDHPLTARVTVNRYWQQLFGVGLVKTSEDFGVQGDLPSHPKLLDWLAREFIDSGWDVKHVHKLIVTSATYRQSSRMTPELLEKDPYNRLLTRGPRFRLSAQALRDQALAIGGLLVEKQGGPGVMPYQPDGVWADVTLGKIKYKQGKGEDLYRRSIYTFWRRSVAPTMFFDNQARQECSVRPSMTNTPLHALTLLNDVTYIEASRAMAQRVIEQADTPVERVQLAFRAATARRATAAELGTLIEMLDDLMGQFQADPDGAKKLIAIGASPADEAIDAAELAAYACLMNAILNLDEVVTKG